MRLGGMTIRKKKKKKEADWSGRQTHLNFERAFKLLLRSLNSISVCVDAYRHKGVHAVTSQGLAFPLRTKHPMM